MTKLTYETPEMEMVYFDTKDVITTSPIGDPDFDATAPDFEWGDDGWGNPWGDNW